AEAGVANLRFVQGDAQVHPLAPDLYDVVISSFGVMFFDDPAAAFANIIAGLRPGGRLAFLCWQDDMRNEVFAIPLRVLSAHARPPEPGDGDLFADRRQVTDLLTGAGWTAIEIEPITEPARIGSDVPDVMTYVCGMPRIRTLIVELGDPALTGRVIAGMTEAFTARRRPDGVWVDTAAWLVSARRAG